ncbi:Mlr4739 protein [Sphingobium indicum BiD32]|uniref:Mlr4739 protein n=1 Tax=Sphingobium indicum BiD32 TaxID=1301087 RepID=N1MMZ2_9SPHN|nr:Mlr4739 protein [Sphingobium indicum BiD32]
MPASDGKRAALLALLAWLLCSAAMLWLFRGDFSTLGFRDPDDAMRLAQVRDWIGGQAFWDVSQHRVNPPTGGPMHWSRIVDMPIAGLILLLRPLLGMATAELVACAIVPLLLLAGLTTALFIAAKRIAGAGIALLAVALLLTAPSILVQFTPLRIDHHGWQIMAATLALCGAMDPRPLRGGIVAGLVLALWLQISSEGLPYAALFAAVFALRHWIDRAETPRYVGFTVALGASALLPLMLLRGPAAVLARHCDALSFVYVWPLVALAAATLLAARLIGPFSPPRRFLIAATGGGAALVTFTLTGGPCLSGDPFAALGPLAYKLWYLQVMEGRPIWEQSLSMAGVILLPTLLGLIATLLAARSAGGPARMRWLTLALLLTGAMLVAIMVMRAVSVAHVLALPGTAWLLIALFRRVQASASAIVRIFGSVALVLLTPAGLCALWVANAATPEPAKKASANCRAANLLATLRGLPPATLFAPLDLGPDILVQTRHSVIGTAHHRNAAGITAVIGGFVYAPDQARSVIEATGARYVVTCDGLNEYRLYGEANRNGLAAQLARGATPDWLEQLPSRGPLKIYRIRPPRS